VTFGTNGRITLLCVIVLCLNEPEDGQLRPKHVALIVSKLSFNIYHTIIWDLKPHTMGLVAGLQLQG
jgi:hypothetical protein